MTALDSQTIAQAKQFEEKYGLDLVSLTRTAETSSGQGCPVAEALKGKSEVAQAEAFPLMAKINAEDRKTDLSLLELKPFDYMVGSTHPSALGRALNWVEDQTGNHDLITPVHNMGLNFEVRRPALVFESWDVKSGRQTITDCTSRTEFK